MYYILLNFVKHVRQIFWQQKISFVPNFRAFQARAKNMLIEAWNSSIYREHGSSLW